MTKSPPTCPIAFYTEIKKQIAVEIVEEYELSIARACKLMEIHRSYYYYQERWDDTKEEEAIRTAAQYDMFSGFWGWCPGVQKKVSGAEHNGWQR